LYVIAGQTDPHGLALKDEIEEYYESEVHHGRLYPNLDTLVTKGLVGDVLPRLPSWASHPVSAGQVNPDGWDSTLCDRRHWLRHEADTPTLRGASRYRVLCRSAWSAHVFRIGSRRCRHRINCQFSTHGTYYDRLFNHAYGAYPTTKVVDFAPVFHYKGTKDRRTNVYRLTDRGRRELSARREWEAQYLDEVVAA
jgi:hypothetical protein